MKTRLNSYLIAGLLMFLVCWLFTGVYADKEFYELNIFLKIPPTFKIYFYSPTGESDLTLSDLEPSAQYEELAFEKYVYYRHTRLTDIAEVGLIVLMQLTITFLLFGIAIARRKVVYKKWQLFQHALICSVPTVLCIAAAITFPKLALVCLAIALAINYAAFRLFKPAFSSQA